MAKRILFALLVIVILAKLSNDLYCQTSSMKTIDSLKVKLQNSKNADTNRVNILRNLSYKYYSIDPQLGLATGRKALALAKKLNYKLGMAESYNSLGINYWTISNYPYALKNLLVALDLFLEIGDSVGIAKINNNLGLIYCLLDMNDKGVKYFRNAANYRNNHKDIIGQIMNYVNIAGAYRQIQNNNLALEYYHKALSVVSQHKKDEFKFHIYLNIGVAYIQMKDYASAINYMNKAKNENQNFGMQDQYRIAIYKAEYGRLILTYISDSSKTKTKIPEFEIHSKSLIHECLSNIQSSTNFFKEISATAELKNSYFNLSDAYAAMNRTDSAYSYLLKADVLRDSLIIKNDIVKVKVLEMERALAIHKNEIKKRYEINSNFRVTAYISIGLVIILLISLINTFITGKKNKKLNISLSEKNSIISQSNIELETLVNELSEKQIEIEDSNDKLHAANAAKDKFFSIISHDLRSPFTGIIGLSELLATEIESLSKEDTSRISRGILSSAKSTYELLNGLLEWAKSQMSIVSYKPQIANTADICQSIIKSLMPIANVKSISINSNIANNINIFCDIDMFSAILRNLISNSIKFTNSGGTIEIDSRTVDKFIQFSVIDSGVGIATEILEKLFTLDDIITSVGTNDEKGSGFGLLLCKEFIDKHNCKIWVESIIGQGSTFHFTMPKA